MPIFEGSSVSKSEIKDLEQNSLSGLEQNSLSGLDFDTYIYIIYWNSYAVAMYIARLRIPFPPHELRSLEGSKDNPA